MKKLRTARIPLTDVVYFAFCVCLLILAYDFEVAGLPLFSATHKGAFLLILLAGSYPAGNPKRATRAGPLALIILAIAAPLAFGTISDRTAIAISSVRGFISLAAGALLVTSPLPLKPHQSERLLHLIQYLPLICVVMGIASMPFGGRPWRLENGVFRLAGTASPAHLAMLCFGAIAATSLLYSSKARRVDWFLGGAAAVIMALTGTRAGLVASAITLLSTLSVVSKIKSSGALMGAYAGAIGVAVTFGVAVSRGIERSYGGAGGQLDSSGRFTAWKFFYARFQESPIFGHGMGSVLDMHKFSSDWQVRFFTVPHNEYLRFMVDLGLLGSGLFLISQIWIFYIVWKGSTTRLWLFFMLVAHLLYSYFDNTYGTVQYSILYFTLLGISMHTSAAPRLRARGKEGARNISSVPRNWGRISAAHPTK